uniref:Synaptobrevin, longin-like domain protein n=1 Tax=Tanacetum cinerariifolium TaxID=118510 RepID=A0A6L2MWK2_TANCI|nr:hypothetical protein [Tanacetum cinerariifolium]
MLFLMMKMDITRNDVEMASILYATCFKQKRIVQKVRGKSFLNTGSRMVGRRHRSINNPAFWNTVVVKCSGDVTRLQALVDKKKIVISEDAIREILRLDDAEGVVCLPNEEIFTGLAQMGYEKPSTKLTFYKAFFSNQWKFLIHTILQSLSAKRTSWNEFSTAMAFAVICLSKGQRFNFSRVGKGCSGVESPLFENMLQVRDEIADDAAQPTSPLPPSPIIPSSPPHQSPTTSPSQAVEGSSILVQQVLDKCSALVLRVEGLESANTAQQLEILKLKARVKKLERLNKLITEVATTTASIPIPAVEPAVVAISVAKPAAKPKVLKIVPAALTVSTRKRKGVVIRDPEEELHDDTPAETQSAKDKGKGILVEDPKPMKKKDQIAIDEEYARKLQEEEESHAQAKDVQAKDAPAKGIQIS